MFSPLYALFALRIGAQVFQTGAAWATYTAIAGLMIIIFGKMEDSFKKKYELIVIGYFWLAAGALSFLLAKSPTSLFVVLGFNAIGAGILAPAWKAAYTHFHDRGKEASEWSFFDGGNMLITAVAALAGGYIVKRYGFHAIFVSMFVIQVVAALVSIRLVGLMRKSSY